MAEMSADEMLVLARLYVAANRSAVDTVEITAFVEWAYEREGRNMARMALLPEIEGAAGGRAHS